MDKPCELPTIHSGEERLLSSQDFVLRIFVGLMLLVGATKELSQAFSLERLYPSFCLNKERPGLTPAQEDGDDQGFVELELGPKADVTLPKTLSDESINRGLICAHMHFIAWTQKILTFMF